LKARDSRAIDSAEAQLVGIGGGRHLREGAEGEGALHFADVVVEDGGRTERLRQLEAVDDL